MILSLDTETTGIDVRHGAQPYLVTFCDEAKDNTWFEWDVDPLTRMPVVVYEDLGEIQEMIDQADRLVLQNPKFDVAALQTVFMGRLRWDWSKVDDCLLAGHLLASNHSHKLEDMVLEYLGINVQPFEVAVQKATEECRRLCRRDYPKWAIAKKGRPDMPSAKEKVWKYDMWLPRALFKVRPHQYPEEYETATADYANSDSLTTLILFKKLKELLKQRGLYGIYQERLKLLPVVEKMENYGITLSQTRLDELSVEYTEEADKCHRVCINLSDGELESLPVNGRSNALNSVIFDKFKLVSSKKTDKGNPSMDKDVLEHWLLELSPQSKAHVFVRNLQAYRKRKTALGYMKSYRKFWLPLEIGVKDEEVIQEGDDSPILQKHQDSGGLLDLDSQSIEQRLRAVQVSKRDPSTSSELQNAHREDTEGDASVAPLRQSRLRKSRSSVSGNPEKQHGRYDSQGKRRQSARHSTSSSQTDRKRGAGDAKTIREQVDESIGIDGKIQSEQIAHLRDCKQKILVPSKLKGWFRLHPGLNVTGTDTLRWSSSRPNEQNISKKEGFNLRYMFGPAPGREWWSLDAENIELRIPAYEAGEDEMIDLFDHPDDPPYFGSYHLLIFDVLHHEMFRKYGVDCKKKFASTWYGWTKGGNFAVQYGAVESSGTADRAYHVANAQRKIQRRFTKIKLLNEKMIQQAGRLGYVETIPDRTVSDRGYPLLCTRSRWGKVKPTIPLAYHVSGTAMWWMARGMVRCQEYLDTLPNHHMVMQVHDELVFDFPKGIDEESFNLFHVSALQDLMEQGGDDLGLPTPVSVEYHADNWSEGVSV